MVIEKPFHRHLLSCPLDVHSGNVARKLGLLLRKQNDAKALQELDVALRKLDPADPAKYDFALLVWESLKVLSKTTSIKK